MVSLEDWLYNWLVDCMNDNSFIEWTCDRLIDCIQFYTIENLGVDNKELFEGDMILPPHVLYKAEHGMDVDSSRKRASIRRGLWPKGEVPFAVFNGLGKGE